MNRCTSAVDASTPVQIVPDYATRPEILPPGRVNQATRIHLSATGIASYKADRCEPFAMATL